MKRIRNLIAVCLVAAFAAPALAQPGGGRPGGGSLPEVGSTLPSVTLYDEEGREVSTDTLRGHYTVMVFGCLT